MAREPIPEPKRKRLEKVFEVATKKAAAATTPSDFDYAAELLFQCVKDDPGNAFYVRAYLDCLQKKFGNNKKGSSLAQFKERGARAALKKALAQEQWDEAIQHGLKVLTVNPWDTATLLGMASAANKSGDFDCEICYLMSALAGAPKDPVCNRRFAIAMAERGQIDKAITFWHRVEEALPNDEEARRAIASLMVQKANATGKFDEDDDFARRQKVKTQQLEEQTYEQRLLKKIQDEPAEIAPYLELAQHYVGEDRFAEAEDLFARAFELSDGDDDIREKWEDCQLRRLHQKIARAQDPEEKKRLQDEYFRKDVEFYKARVERYPGNLLFRFELGYRYMKTKQYAEAIRELQAAKNDPRRKGLCLLVLGECFQQIKQYRLAMSHYQEAVKEIPERDAENRKRAYYLAGRLAMFLGDLPTAEKYLSYLAGLDFTYKDVSKLLDKLAKLRENPQSGLSQSQPPQEGESQERPEPEYETH